MHGTRDGSHPSKVERSVSEEIHLELILPNENKLASRWLSFDTPNSRSSGILVAMIHDAAAHSVDNSISTAPSLCFEAFISVALET